MDRKAVIVRDRVSMIKKALGKAGYLQVDAPPSEQTPDQFREIVVSVLSDLMHLGQGEFGVPELNSSAFSRKEAGELMTAAVVTATGNWGEERLTPTR